ncbi:MAG TPA: hypothetical protein VEJ84_19445 [Acidimicrobiales bacterium]|nr:hypothetical protein [Acidimicrobiales bacterium]
MPVVPRGAAGGQFLGAGFVVLSEEPGQGCGRRPGVKTGGVVGLAHLRKHSFVESSGLDLAGSVC